MSLDIICSSKLTVFLELRSRKTVRFSEQIIGSLSTHVFETRTATGSELFSLSTCFHTTTFTLLRIFSPLEMISTKMWERPLSWHVKCSLPVAVRVSKTRVLKLPNVRGQISEHIFAPNEGYCLYRDATFTAVCSVCKFQVVVWQSPSMNDAKVRAARSARLFSLIQPIILLIYGVVIDFAFIVG